MFIQEIFFFFFFFIFQDFYFYFCLVRRISLSGEFLNMFSFLQNNFVLFSLDNFYFSSHLSSKSDLNRFLSCDYDLKSSGEQKSFTFYFSF